MSKTIATILINIACGLVVLVIREYVHPVLVKILGARRARWAWILIVFAVFVGASVLLWWTVPPTPKAVPIFSDFEEGRPVNIYGCHWDDFNDNPYGGDSDLSMKVFRRSEHEKPYDNSDAFYAELDYVIGSSNGPKEPYCGSWAGFSPRALESRDLSRYKAVAMEAWHEGPIPDNAAFLMEIIPKRGSGTYDSQFLYDFTKDVGIIQPRTIYIPFSIFLHTDRWSGERTSFDNKKMQEEIQHIAILVRGTSGVPVQGRLCVDNIGFK